MKCPRPIFGLSIAAASLLGLAGCGELIHPAPQPAVYVTSGASSQILAFSSSAAGDPAPLGAITLPAGVVAGYIAGDSAGNLYVTTSTDIREYPAGATGSAAPSRVIPFDSTTRIANITGFAADPAGNLYISEFNTGVAVFSSTANGSVAPARTILVGAASGLEFPEALATDHAGNLYVANVTAAGQGSIYIYGPTASGNAAPLRALNVSTTGMAVDASGNLYVTANGGIEVFSPTASGNAVPVRMIQGAATGFARFTGGIAMDSAANIYVVTWGSIFYNQIPQTPTILEFPASAAGDAAPAHTFTPTAWTPAIPVLAVH